jgi:hypothetical protein
MDATLPQQLIELSLDSLRQTPDHGFQLNQQTVQRFNNTDASDQVLRLRLEPLSLTPLHKESIVAAVDTSTIKIGETSRGIVVAVRGANIWKQKRRYRYMRFGPFIFHITEENKKQVYKTLERAYFSSPDEHNYQAVPSLFQMPMRIASLLERWLQTMAAQTMNHGLILFDGSLTAGTAETPTHRMKKILGTARNRDNIVLAFSKVTNLRVNGHLITDLLPERGIPYLLGTEGLKPKPPIVLLGDVYVARLTKGKLAFRLDIDKEIPPGSRTNAVEELLGNDLFAESYPETLRLAHILCTFTANEVLAMQHYVTRKFGLQFINRPDMHRLLFGLFGKGESFS